MITPRFPFYGNSDIKKLHRVHVAGMATQDRAMLRVLAFAVAASAAEVAPEVGWVDLIKADGPGGAASHPNTPR